MSDYATDTRARAAQIEHEWDRRAIDWPLTSESVVVEVGGYIGRWALQIAARYAPRLYVFEPQTWACEVCKEVLGGAATVLDYGLGVQSCTMPMGAWETDGCSFVQPSTGHEGQIIEIGLSFDVLAIDHIDLMLINIEGYEYTLIPYMFAQGIFPDRLMVQMHDFAGDSVALRATLARHYRLAWDYGDVLSAWGRP